MTKDDLIENLKKENGSLKKEINFLKNQNSIKDEIVIQQSKMASMGEVISNIGHQWRQPLMEISTLMLNMEANIKLVGSISNEDILETIEKSNTILSFMSQTIEDFRDFFSKNKKKEYFFVTKQTALVVNMVRSSLSNNNIKLNIILKNNPRIYGYKNEYAQVLMNIIANAKDIIISKNINDAQITIRVYENETHSILEVEDNGGGVSVKPIDKIFEPFFTDKKLNGTGIGLFMSKLIIETNMDGKLKVVNKQKGACFTIELPLS